MIPQHLKPSMVFTPAAPPKRATPQEEGVPLHKIDRRLWPHLSTTSGVGQAKSQAGWAAEMEEQASVRAGEQASAGDCWRVVDPLPPACSDPPAPACPEAPASPDASRKRGGRPRAITSQRRVQLLHILRRGQSRRHAAQRMGIDAATITRAIRRDPRLALEVMEAEEEGQVFLEIWDRLYSLQETTLELKPVVSTPQLEREKEYLIRCGLPAAYVRRLRLRTVDDPLPPDLPPEFEQANREIKIRPWKKGWRRKKAKVEAGWW